jgi:hypothetical protein
VKVQNICRTGDTQPSIKKHKLLSKQVKIVLLCNYHVQDVRREYNRFSKTYSVTKQSDTRTSQLGTGCTKRFTQQKALKQRHSTWNRLHTKKYLNNLIEVL